MTGGDRRGRIGGMVLPSILPILPTLPILP